MEYVRIATYTINNGTFEELAEMARTELLRKFQEQPGFIRYGLANVGDKTCVSVSLWNTRQDAEASTSVATAWVKERIADRVELRSTMIGDLPFFEGIPATV